MKNRNPTYVLKTKKTLTIVVNSFFRLRRINNHLNIRSFTAGCQLLELLGPLPPTLLDVLVEIKS